MTSQPASRSMVARTLIPLSCPSQPGLASSTRAMSDPRGSGEITEHRGEDPTDLTESGPGFGRIHQKLHDVASVLGRVGDGQQGLVHLSGIPVDTQLVEQGDLRLHCTGVELVHGQLLLTTEAVPVTVGPDPDL